MQRSRAVTLTTALISLALSACAGSSAATSSTPVDSGVTGRVWLGPTCPVQRPGETCMRPYQATLAVHKSAGGRLVKRFRSSTNGRFRVHLPPGRYRFQATHKGYPRLQPISVTVRPHRFATITIRFDTGIR
jgi:hypothetical protein